MEKTIGYFKSKVSIKSNLRLKDKVYEIKAIGDNYIWYKCEDGRVVNTYINDSLIFLKPVKATRLAIKMYPNAIRCNNYILVDK